ncbi:DUF6520 family protein [Chitinophaga filiformis]|uniref:Uncharacterized protein n=1 Tax=Chitinophaga filiformis TaxID=104663 RepID=A0A1G7HVP6_CHIFI|nr:DUF6520 family protein [Chitinophaga filiformis]SDF04455.1 hypothetical protein SAMN04488121_101618 [Chitinophaga filiformis]
MKKAKIVLSAVALFAVVGGAFAFKATKYQSRNVYSSYATTTNGQPTILCSTTNLHAGPNGNPTTTYTTVLAGGLCPAPVATFTVVADI